MTDGSARNRIQDELRKAMRRLGGDESTPLTARAFTERGAGIDLLAVIGSIGDTLSDEEVLNFLLELNAGRPIITIGLSAEDPPKRLDG